MDQQYGGLLLVRNPTAGSTNRVDIEASMETALAKYPSSVTNCIVGNDYSLVEVDRAIPIHESTALFDEHPTIEAMFSETVTIGMSGNKIPFDKVFTICQATSEDLKCSFNGQLITISGSWSHVKKAREEIHRVILESAREVLHSIANEDLKVTTRESTTRENSSSSSLKLPSSLPSSGSCSEIISVPPIVIKILKHKNVNLGPGISYSEGGDTVYFKFPTEKELDVAIEAVQNRVYELEKKLTIFRMDIPPGIHQDEEFAMIVSELEDKYGNTVITWLDGKLEIEIISDKGSMDLVIRDLRIKMDGESIAKPRAGVKHHGSNGGLLKVVENFFSPPPPAGKITYQKQVDLSFPNGRSLTLKHGNILKESVDAIVNPSNERLAHVGGLAQQINKTSRGAVQQLSNKLLAGMGSERLPTGTVVHTEIGRYGDLQCKYVLHAVGPNAHEIRSEQQCNELLKKTVCNVLKEAGKLSCNTIAVPAISSGLFGMSKDVVAEIIVGELVNYQQQQSIHNDHLKDIRVVIWDKETYIPFLVVVLGVKNSLEYH